MINKNNLIWLAVLLLGIILIGYSIFGNNNQVADNSPSPTPSESLEPSLSPSPSPMVSRVPLPTSNGKTTFIGEPVPWNLLPAKASCKLQGEIRFINKNTYDNQDALFTYSGVDHPGRNVIWSVVPEDGIRMGPNIFARMPIPNGTSLLGIDMPENPKYKVYEVKAVMEYGRLVDDKGNIVTVGGNIKVSQQLCEGKATIVLP